MYLIVHATQLNFIRDYQLSIIQTLPNELIPLYSAVPDSPENITLTSKSSRAVNLSWSDGRHGSSVVRSYTVKITSKGAPLASNLTCNAASLAEVRHVCYARVATIGQLHPYTNYEVTLAARNDVGSSEDSFPLSFTTDEEGIINSFSISQMIFS